MIISHCCALEGAVGLLDENLLLSLYSQAYDLIAKPKLGMCFASSRGVMYS